MVDVVIELRGRTTASNTLQLDIRGVWRIATSDTPSHKSAQIISRGALIDSRNGLFILRSNVDPEALSVPGPWVKLPPALDYLEAGDVVSLTSDGAGVRVLWRSSASINAVLLTEQCDNYCLMCSQPPRTVDDRWLLDEAVDLVRALDSTVGSILFTGGEPTLFGESFLDLLALCREEIPLAEVHVLSNGRRFSDRVFAQRYAEQSGPKVMIGIPIYGAEDSLHDFVVQAKGAFNETVRGILNLAESGARIEIRVVIQKHVVGSLRGIADFIVRNIPFVDQVALMALEMTGFARSNQDEVWVDPHDYSGELAEAALRLESARIPTRIYNHQLCLLDRSVWHLAVRSISDWKNHYEPVCDTCAVRERCGGFFSTGLRRVSDHIQPLELSTKAASPILDSGTAVTIRSVNPDPAASDH